MLLDTRNNIDIKKPDLTDDESLWLIFDKHDLIRISEMIESWGYTNHLENYTRFCLMPDFKRIDMFHVSKNKAVYFKSTTYTRPCTTPYVNKDGSPRGWYVNSVGEKVRDTGLGNVFFISSFDTLKELLQRMTK